MFFFYFLFVIASLALTYGWVECPMNIWGGRPLTRMDGISTCTRINSEINTDTTKMPLEERPVISEQVFSLSTSRGWRRHWLISRNTTQLNVFRWIIYPPRRHFQHRAALTRFQRANFQMVSTRSLISNPPLLFQDKLFEKCLIANLARILSFKVLKFKFSFHSPKLELLSVMI